MSAATTIAPAAAARPASRPRRRSIRWALARVEGRRLLGHPLFLLGMTTAAVTLALPIQRGDDLFGLAGGCFTSFGISGWLLLAPCFATSRARRDAAQELYDAQPMAPRIRTEAALLSLGWAVLAGTALVGVATVALAGLDGELVVERERYQLRPLELAQGPLFLAMAGALGVLVGSWTRRAYPGVICALALFFPPLGWMPWIVFGDDVPQGFFGDWLVGASVSWHLTALAGIAVLAAAGALARHDRRPRVGLLALVGLAAMVAGIALGSPARGALG